MVMLDEVVVIVLMALAGHWIIPALAGADIYKGRGFGFCGRSDFS